MAVGVVAEATVMVFVIAPHPLVLSLTDTEYVPGVLTEILDVVKPPGLHVYVYGRFPPVTVEVKASVPELAEHNTGAVGVIATVRAGDT